MKSKYLTALLSAIFFGSVIGLQPVVAAVPSKPTGVTVTNQSPSNTSLGSARVLVAWGAATGALGYSVAASAAGQSDITNVVTGSPLPTSTTLVGLQGGVSYKFVVTAINVDGKTDSDPATFTAQSIPDVPASISVDIAAQSGSTQQATISWTAPVNNGGTAITGYTISTLEDANITATETANKTSDIVKNLKNGTAYTFQIVATNAIGTSAATKAKQISTPDVPGIPTGVAATVSGSTLKLQWAPPTNTGNTTITGYAVHIYDSSGSELTAYASKPTTASASVTGLTAGSYTAKVAAVNGVGTSALSAASSAVSIALSSTLLPNTPVLTPSTVPDKNIGATVAVTATAPSSGLVTLSASPSTVCTYSTSTGLITAVGAGLCSVVATTPSTSTYDAGAASFSFNVIKNSQTISFTAIPPQTYPGTYTLQASSSAQTSIVFSAVGSCSISGSTLTLSSAGTCTVTANSSATSLYNAASPVVQSFSVTTSAPVATTSTGGGGGGGGGAPLAPSPSPTPSVSLTPTPSASPSPTHSTVVVPSATPTPSPSATVLLTPTPTPQPSSTPTSSTLLKPLTLSISSSVVKQITATNVLAIPTAKAAVTNIQVGNSQSASIVASTNVGKAFVLALPKEPSGTTVSLTYLGLNKKSVTISSSTLKSASAVNLPAVAFKRPGKFTLLLKVGKATKTITVTVKK